MLAGGLGPAAADGQQWGETAMATAVPAVQRRLAATLGLLAAARPASSSLSEADAVLERHRRNQTAGVHFPADGASMPCPSHTPVELAAGRRLSAPPPRDPGAETCFAVVGDFGTGMSEPDVTRPELITCGVSERGVSTRPRGDAAADPVGYLQVAELVRSWGVDFVITTGDNNYSVGDASTIDAHVGKGCASQFCTRTYSNAAG